MVDNIRQFCFDCKNETEFKYVIKVSAVKRAEGYGCVVCGCGGTCDDNLRKQIEEARNITLR